ncbi:MAG: 2-oxoacid:acceptor oxidoreductase family protein [Nitrospiraceae bacterium]|nr:2-oxoacid:acceptor oxidoreductase family protein [Nitrospiraceae bacterium]
MSEMIEIRWHGRGGQGTVTAAKVLADACLSGGRYVQAFPEYGPERAGAPLRAYNRISDRELRLYCPVINPGFISIVDATIMDAMNLAEGATEDAVFIVNTVKEPAEIRKALGASATQKVFTVDATNIAIAEIGRPLPNSPMLGAVARATGLVGLDHLTEEVKKSFGKKFSEKIINGNVTAAQRGYKEVREG